MNDHKNREYLQDIKVDNLRQRSLRSGSITLVNQGLKFLMQTGSTVVMARILTPEDFGIVAMVFSLLGFFTLLRDFGLSVATIQKETIAMDELSGLFWVNVLLGSLIMVALLVAAPFVAAFFEDQRAFGLTIAFGAMAILSSLGVQHAAILQRQMRFEAIAISEFLSLLFGIIAGIVSALYGLEYWALVIKEGFARCSSTVFFWLQARWMPGLPKRSSGLKNLIKFGGSLTLANFLGYANHNIDNILIGKIFGEAAVGFYAKGQGLLNKPLRQILPPIMRVATPMFSRLTGDPARFNKTSLQMVEIVCFGGCLMPLLIFPTADWVVLLMLGAQWEQTVPIFSLLAVFGLLEPLAYLLNTILVTSGQPGEMAKWRAATLIIVFISLLVGLFWGIIGVAAAYVVSGVITRCWLIFFVGKRINLPGSKFIATCTPFVAYALITSVFLKFLRYLWEPSHFSAGLIIYFSLGTTLYLLLIGSSPRGRVFLRSIYGMGIDTIKGFQGAN